MPEETRTPRLPGSQKELRLRDRSRPWICDGCHGQPTLFKLGELLQEEYELHKGAKNKVEFLSTELTSMLAADRKSVV